LGLLGTTITMKPSPQFINMISVLYQQRQKAITNNDLIKHSNQSLTFYSISEAKFVNLRIISQTDHFSDQVMIEIEQNATRMIIGTDREEKIYRKLSNMELTNADGHNLIHWRVSDSDHNMFTAVKLISPDGAVQIKLISFDNTTQIIHNVCELPNNF
jgi:hypothetical protein